MGIRVDFSGTEVGNFDAIPAGSYVAKVTGGELREAGENAKYPGSQYINWEFTIQEGEYTGRKQWTNTSLREGALFGLKELLAATGKFDVDGDLDFDIEDVIGSDVRISVRVKDYKGEAQNEVRRVKALDAAESGSSLMP
jgi:hypothetical protein